MDYKKWVASALASLIVFIYRIFLLAVFPYKTMRSISEEDDNLQIGIIFMLIGIYFFWANRIREYEYEPIILLLLTVFHFIFTVLFFSYAGLIFGKTQISIKKAVFTIAYSLMPTLIWLVINSILFLLIPPPRTQSVLGSAFSIIYLSALVLFLMWKLILQYLAIRFSTHMSFFQISYSMILFLVFFIPYAIILYNFGYFRIPIF